MGPWLIGQADQLSARQVVLALRRRRPGTAPFAEAAHRMERHPRAGALGVPHMCEALTQWHQLQKPIQNW